ncbi:hypothetical protein Scep_002237 [Stephania cephalantha]|uniref:Uncharacterized protein n=1 Tax=Stephania cephalantha TaxID=152367 RepID=A0AAP0L9S9_9MAGN
MIYFTGEVSRSSPGMAHQAPGKRIEEASDSFMHAPLGSGDIARLVELRSCNWVVAITGWMSNCPANRSGRPRGGGLPCGGCRRFESAYLQLVNLADTKDGIALKLTLTARFKRGKAYGGYLGTRETRKGVASDEMLRGVENKHRSGDSRICQPFELSLESMGEARDNPANRNILVAERKRKQKRFP